ncbi:Ti type entry exclusion protein TrbK [Sinorhizobium terangae]|uniref:Entry exclusion protein TrbK n=1 Tax=Sinorhizobium terangae TaxID=110322 RepID=A0A6N7LDF4_SINTE|nr:entry exclusion protein TrbK [Sinorhizobium terangae]MBB4189425.1 Ti type entry exclusion protein TrbK [Sinorhizobium terangae]MQX15792.1 entry exclusion protein TrbK [Sinorhizobium terangae]
MVRTKLILITIATILTIDRAGIWFIISEKQTALERRAKFYGSSKEYPTSGGQKMKVEW